MPRDGQRFLKAEIGEGGLGLTFGPTLALTVRKVTLWLDDQELPEALHIDADLPGGQWAALEAAEVFGLTEASRGPSLVDSFSPDRPVDLELRLDGARLAELLGGPDVRAAFRALVEERLGQAGSPTADVEAWTWVSAVQDMGDGIKGGMRNVLLPEG